VRVLVAMSGGVDSSVAAAVVRDEGHDVTGVTLKLWGGDSDSGCCSVSDVDDARRVAQQLGIDHVVFNFGDDFTEHVVGPYVAAHAEGRTPNPCIECNRHLKFDRLARRAEALGFDAVATGHHARVVAGPAGSARLARGADAAKDQSYVLYVLGARELARVQFPVGSMTKAEVRARADRLGLRTAAKPDSQDVCFITSVEGRGRFLAPRIPLRPGRVVDTAGAEVGRVDAVELVTIGQRRGLGLAGAAAPRYAVDVDVSAATVVVGSAAELLVQGTTLERMVWADEPFDGEVRAQCSAHGKPARARIEPTPDGAGAVVRWATPRARVAPGQSVVAYVDDIVVGGGIVVRDEPEPG
jgi:tRNA-specific 2-thiouridylase